MIADARLDLHREAHSTPWLTDVVFAQAHRLGYGHYFLTSPRAIEDDHVPFLELGVPAVDIIDLNYGRFNLYWHTTYDTVDKCSPASLAMVARVVLATLAALEANLRSQPTGASLTWPFADAGLPSRREGRKSQSQPQLPTRSPDATRLDNPTDGASFFPVPAVSRAYLGHARTYPPAIATTSLRPLAIRRCGRRHSRLSTVGGETTVPPSTSACASSRVPCGNGSDTSFSTAILAGTAGWRHLLRPGGTALLCFPATRDPPVSGPSQKDWPSLALAAERIFFGSTRKSGSRPGEQAPPASRCPARKQGGKGEKSVCIKTAFPSSASSATTHS